MDKRRWLVLLVVFVARTSMGFQFQSVASLSPFIMNELDIAFATLGTLIGLFMLPAFTLGNLIFMMRKSQIHTTAVNIKMIA